MPSSNAAPRPSSQVKKSNTIVPAIPLALSKPRSKSKAKTTKGTPAKEDASVTSKAKNDDVLAQSLVNGHTDTGSTSATAAVEAKVSDISEEVTSEVPGTLVTTTNNAPNGFDSAAPEQGPTPLSATSPKVLTTIASVTGTHQLSSEEASRQIRVELPPAFVPSAESHTPRSTTSSSFSRPPHVDSRGHSVRPSASSIVFGGMESHSSSPAPPISPGFGFPPPATNNDIASPRPHLPSSGNLLHGPSDQRTLSGGSQNQFTQQATRPHHHPSANVPSYPQHLPNSTRPSPAPPFSGNGMHRNGPSFSARVDGPAIFSAVDAQNGGYGPRSPMADFGPNQPRGDMRNHRATFSRQMPSRPPPFNHIMPPPSQYPHPDMTASIENAESLREFVVSQFSNSAFADCRLSIAESQGGDVVPFDGHSIILARSPKLLQIIQDHRRSKGSGTTDDIPVLLPGGYIQRGSFTDALKYLYGGPVLSIDPTSTVSTSPGDQQAKDNARLELAFQHIAIGCWLQLPALSVRGVEIATYLLRWDTIAVALKFAMHGGLSNHWIVEDGSEDKLSSSSDESLSPCDSSSSPPYDPYSTNVLQRIVGFMIHMFPQNFYLDTSAPELTACPRLPFIAAAHESRPSLSDPRLSQIRFGNVPTEDLQRPSFATTTISSVLLSLPFPVLKVVLENFELAIRLGPDTIASIIRQVVNEREGRRSRVLRAHIAATQSIGAGGSASSTLVSNLYWEEFFELAPSHRAGIRLARRRRAIDTPTSSDALSENAR